MNKKNISTNLLLIFLSFFLFILHIFISNLLPEPFNRLSVIYIVAMCLLLFQQKNKYIWHIFALSLTAELFYSSPFGLITGALLISIASMDWILTNLLTNRFFIIVFVAGLLGMIIYKIAYISVYLLLHHVANYSFTLSSAVIYDFLIEALINAGVLTLVFIIPNLLIKKLNPKYLISR